MLRAAIRVGTILAPALAAGAVAILFTRAVALPFDVGGTLVWCAVFVAAVVGTWLVTAELLQRTLPLATLLDLALVFPDAVPSRFAILRRKVDKRQLETDLRRLRERADPESGPRAQLILELAVALSVHDSRTRSHSERVGMYTDMVAQQLHLTARDTDRLRWAALLHDIGKLAVAPEILNKPELPDDDELESLRNHPVEGYWMIAPLHKWLGPWAAAVRDHHERFDGTGYPNRLSGRAISLGGRIVAVADSYETMTAGRPYRSALSSADAREELVRRSGTHFDPYVVRAFLASAARRPWPLIALGAVFTEVPFLSPVFGRLSQVGSRSVSYVVAAGATATLVVAGLAGPAAGSLVHGPSSRTEVASTAPQLARSGSQLAPPSRPAAPPASASAASPAPAPPSTPAVLSAAPSAAPPAASTSTASTSTASGAPSTQPGTGAQGGGAKKALYPPGIARRGTLPRGIAKQANPFAQWRLRH